MTIWTRIISANSAVALTACLAQHQRRYLVFVLWLLIPGIQAADFALKVEPVTNRAFALVGDIGPRTAQNHALNNTLGFVVTDDGVVLVGSGTSPAGAQLIKRAVAGVTHQPIRWVVNIGAQDHHWMGNDYFAQRGARIIALQRTVETQRAHAENHLRRMSEVIGEAAAKTVSPVYAAAPIAADRSTLSLGGVGMELIWPDNGHFPGDAVLWLPAQRILFSGDFVFHDRILGIHPFTPLVAWRDAFHAIAELDPAHVVPGHGHPGDLAKAKRDTGDYLDWLVTRVRNALADWQELDTTIELLADAPAFRHLQFYGNWHRRNVHQSYIQLEGE